MFFPVPPETEVALEEAMEAGVVAEDFSEDKGLLLPGNHGQGTAGSVAVGEPNDTAGTRAHEEVVIGGLEGSLAFDRGRRPAGDPQERGKATRDLEGRGNLARSGKELRLEFRGQ